MSSVGEIYIDGLRDSGAAIDRCTARRAIRTVCASAADAGDAGTLLEALGLTSALGDLAELRALGRGEEPPA